MQRPLLALAAAMLSLEAFAAAPSSYTIVDLGYNRQPRAVNDAGALVGEKYIHAVPQSYANGRWKKLPIQSDTGAARAVNSGGIVVGWDSGSQVRWKDGKRSVLEGTYGGSESSTPEGIADDGTIVGHDYSVVGKKSVCYTWKRGVISYLPGLGGDGCIASSIDPTGTYIGGYAMTPDDKVHAFIADGTGMHDLGTPGRFSGVHQVNRHGHAAGWLQVNDAGGTGAAYWNGSQLVDLGMHVDGHGEATAINDADDVLVGGSDGHGHTLFYYSAASQTMTPIEPLITNLGAWKFIMDVGSELAVLANDGTIYGIAFFEGNRHAFKLVPSAH
jgi:probable HAF family extracellular repeat protein